MRGGAEPRDRRRDRQTAAAVWGVSPECAGGAHESTVPSSPNTQPPQLSPQAQSPFNLHTSLIWGEDLSGTPQGAGGIGGLLQSTWPAESSTHTAFYHYDSNGNIVLLTHAPAELQNSTLVTRQSSLKSVPGKVLIAAQYRYDAIGKAIKAEGPLASLNRYQFSTKPVDAESGLVYYGYRYLDTTHGRWISRDPIGETSGASLYRFVYNRGPWRLDVMGLTDHSGACPPGYVVVTSPEDEQDVAGTATGKEWGFSGGGPTSTGTVLNRTGATSATYTWEPVAGATQASSNCGQASNFNLTITQDTSHRLSLGVLSNVPIGNGETVEVSGGYSYSWGSSQGVENAWTTGEEEGVTRIGVPYILKSKVIGVNEDGWWDNKTLYMRTAWLICAKCCGDHADKTYPSCTGGCD